MLTSCVSVHHPSIVYATDTHSMSCWLWLVGYEVHCKTSRTGRAEQNLHSMQTTNQDLVRSDSLLTLSRSLLTKSWCSLSLRIRHYCNFCCIVSQNCANKTFFDFYPRDAMLARVFAIATCLDVCLSVCHTLALCLADRKQDREMYTFW